MEQDKNLNENAEPKPVPQTEDPAAETPKGILYETSLKQAEKNAKKEKRKGVMQFIKYALCAASAGIIQIVLFSILQAVMPSNGKTIHFIVEDMDLVTFIATTVALCASILWNFTFNRKFTFKDAGNVPKAMILAFLFYVPFYPFQTWYVHTIKSLLVGAIGTDGAGIIAEGTVMIINFALEFMWQKFVVFRKPKDKKENKPKENEKTGETENADNTNNAENSENAAE
ncbi:MAG TPA: hypothetical protein DCS37_01570 [Clostridiales bacterium]|nr:hypothetical protein [Clostridiales bacterium]